MKNLLNVIKKRFYIIAILPFVIFLIFKYNIFSMNFDESGQYWMSLGQNHFSAFNTPEKGLSDVIKNNISHNLDPGGFTVLLHFWLKVSHHYLWVMLLPMLFFIGFVIYSIKLMQLFIVEKKYYSFLFIPVLFLANYSTFYSVYLRAYTMEYFGIILSIYLLFKIDKPKNFYLYSGIVCSLFLWSRYGFGIHILALFICSLFKFIYIEKNKIKNILIYSTFFILPILFSCVFIYYITLYYQYTKPTNFSTYAINISDGDFIKLLNQIINQVKSYINFPLISLILLIVFFFVYTKKISNLDNYNLKSNNILILVVYIILYHIISIVLSYLGLYPYSINSINCRQYLYFNLICIFFFMVLILNYFNSYAGFIFIFIVFIGCVFAYKEKNVEKLNYYDLLVKYNSKAIIYVSKTNFATIRYIKEERILNLKFKEIKILDNLKNIERGSYIFINMIDLLYAKDKFDNTFEKLENVRDKFNGWETEVYIKK